MFYNEEKTISACESDPSLIFELLKEGHLELLDRILSRKTFDINVCDQDGNDILTKLLKKGQFKIVLKHIKDKRWNINHQNNDGDTFSHILVSMNNINTLDIFKTIMKIRRYNPNIKNNNGQTIFDIAIDNDSTFLASKILEDTRFHEVGVFSFKNYYETYIKTKKYGGYTKVNNLEKILNLRSKQVSPKVNTIINYFKENFDVIKEEVINNKTNSMDSYLNEVLFA